MSGLDNISASTDAATVSNSPSSLAAIAPASCFRSFREFDTITEGFAAAECEGVDALPFVVRASEAALAGIFKSGFGADATSWPSEAMIRDQLRREQDVKGYLGAYNDAVHMTGRDTLSCFDAGTMTHNVVDSESTRSSTSLLSGEMIALNAKSRVDSDNWLAYVISPRSKGCGQLHKDPPHGSNWQYLSSGSKTWYAMSTSFDLGVHNATTFQPGVPPDMAALSLTGDCYKTVIGAGDFVYVPIHWAHAISTTLASVGLSGYGCVPTCMLSPRSSGAESGSGDY